MDMDEFLNSGESRKECKTVSAAAMLEKLKAQSKEEPRKRLDAFLEEVSSIIDFAQQRFDEVSNEYEELAALGNFGVIVSATLQEKPMCYAALGSSKAINNAAKFALLRTMANEFKNRSDDGDEQDDSSGEDD